ncbi:class I SAM-dependent methyltransferase [Mycobacterium shimoidei]|uniref:Uncharacterized protein n=1 Tax=Mycobacterium shimoidei TaxID=29313 RepID=A0A1E3TEA0_MYCSH|nr:class I SAM-dependent methyltransferase [Mycobacterium shimoidei]MCV7260364.1 class I SAM-dependent methyltransferase [Mycobacterium shimoidei]ODR12623.1 GlcNAc transferase [Mycobacterium shimoidei]ORW82146.1 GlcNAc transferase [Mycobacterium shimoidei]SRX95434.1 hypothetical protein [Mesorhizobium loti MAFF303099] [Mycobacterium shimoidei]
MRIAVGEFTPIEQTAFLTQYARALDSRRPHPILGDSLADRIVAKIDYDFAGLDVPTHVVCQQALRAKMLDDRVCDFTSEHPDAVVVELGAGLSTAMLRISPPGGVDWYNVDLPRVIALREQVVPDDERAHPVAASVAEDSWADSIPADRPTMLIADGLLAFLSEPVIVNLFRHITEYFRSGEFAFNDYGRVGALTRVAMKLSPQKATNSVGSQWGYAGFKDAHHPESWTPRIKLVEESSLTHAPEVSLFPGWLRLSTRLAGRFKASARRARILRYRF